MRVLNKSVEMNDDSKLVMMITLELPLTPSQGFFMKGKDFMDALYEAIKVYEDDKTAKATGDK